MKIDKELLIVMKGAEVAHAEADLAEKLTDLFFKVLGEGNRLPGRIIFLGTGVFLTTEGSSQIERLEALAERGVEIVSCITCLTYYGRMDKVLVGRKGDMKDTVGSMVAAGRVVTI